MSENIRSIKINFANDKIAITKWDLSNNSANFQKEEIKLELSVSRIFHKVLNKGRLTEIFEKNDFEVLGNVLYKIICSNPDAREFFLNGLKVVIREKEARCRILLEFSDHAVDLAALPWEYLLIEADADKNIPQFYLGADKNKQFDVIRILPDEKEYTVPVDLEDRKCLKVITIVSNTLTKDFGVDEVKFSDRLLRLQKNFKKEFDSGDEEDRIDFLIIRKPNSETFVDDLNEAIKNIDKEPYILHFFGHAQMKDNIASIGFMNDEDQVEWISSDYFASFFSKNQLHANPEMIVLQACESGQISTEGSGLAMDLVQQGIPAVVAMQNEVTEEISLIFIERFYDAILNGFDVAEAVTRARTYLGCEYKKTPPFKEQYYCDNSFGTPVIFTSTPNLIRLMPKIKPSEQVISIRKMKCPRCGRIYENPRTETCAWLACRSTRLQSFKDDQTVAGGINAGSRSNEPITNASVEILSPGAQRLGAAPINN